MREQPDLTEDFQRAIDNHGYAGGDVDRIETRKCGSDHNDGVEYEFYGRYVPVRPIIQLLADKDGFAIEELSFVDESSEENPYEPHLNIFVADIRTEQPHPAFTEQYL